VGSDGVFYADQVLARHDENYMPPQAGAAIDTAKHERDAAKTVVR
jgi:cytochrome c-type biogenesis protein CcmE